MTDDDSISDDPPSKSARKRHSDDLQALGEALIGLPEGEFEALPLPENLRDAVVLARRITAHGGLYRQKQYIGKLMRKIDAEPIRAALTARHDRERIEAMRFRRLEQWRDRIVREGPPAIVQLATEFPGQFDPATLAALTELARSANQEHRDKLPLQASRELFRKLRESLPQT